MLVMHAGLAARAYDGATIKLAVCLLEAPETLLGVSSPAKASSGTSNSAVPIMPCCKAGSSFC